MQINSRCLVVHLNVLAAPHMSPTDQLKPTIEEIITILKEQEKTLQ